MFKKLLSMALAAIMVMGMGTTAFAAESTSIGQADIKAKIVEIVEKASSPEERDALLVNLLSENPLRPVTNTRSANTITIVDTVTVDENIQVDFYSTDDFGIKELESIGTKQASSRAANYTDTYRASYTIKNVLGGKIVETYVKGYFKYDGTNTPTAYFEDAGYSKGFLIMWDCSSWNDGTGTVVKNKSAYCYADAYYDWTLDVSIGGGASGDIGGGVEGSVDGSVGGGITIQNCNVNLKLNCSKSGGISASVSLEG